MGNRRTRRTATAQARKAQRRAKPVTISGYEAAITDGPAVQLVLRLDNGKTLAMLFETPEQIAVMVTALFHHARQAWPEMAEDTAKAGLLNGAESVGL